MDHVWWRMHLRRLPELDVLGGWSNFQEVDQFMPFLTEALDLPTGSRVLDLGCGHGTYSVRLAQWGYAVTAIEESTSLLRVAQEAGRQHGVELELREADLRTLPERGIFDGALILDYGGFSDLDNAEIMRSVAAALKPGGRLVFGTCNPYYWAREPRTTHQVREGTDLIRHYNFDFPTGAVLSQSRMVLPSGERRALPKARYRAYTIPELRSLVATTGLADLRIYGQDEDGSPRPDRPLNTLSTPYFHCVALRPVHGEAGEGI